MRKNEFGATGIRVSRVGFGCGPLGSRYGRREGHRALSAAFDEGVTLFDTARAYGYGDAERLLGEFLRGKRDRVVVSTKFGMRVARNSPLRRLAKSVARPIFRLLPRVRTAALPQLGNQFVSGAFSVSEMRRSVEESLRELRTDYLDILFIHSCASDTLQDEQLFSALDALVAAGKIRCYGVAGAASVVAASIERRPKQVRAAQFHQSIFAPTDAETVMKVRGAQLVGKMAHQPFGGPEGIQKLKSLILKERMDAPDEALREKLRSGVELGLLADIAINSALLDTDVAVSVCSMFSVEHIWANASAARGSRFSDEELRYLKRVALLQPA